jgi:hypothetical protein
VLNYSLHWILNGDDEHINVYSDFLINSIIIGQ